MSKRLLIATSNLGKLREMRNLLKTLRLELVDLTNFPNIQTVDESGLTFAENASLKAIGYAQQAGVLTLADDSGLEVEALNGAPGVRSARYMDPEAPYSDRIVGLLSQIESTGSDNRAAHFVCAVAIASADGQLLYSIQQTCEGRIAESPRGSGGFGYDPIFISEGSDQTFAELPAEVKNRISHRARALSVARGFLASLTTY